MQTSTARVQAPQRVQAGSASSGGTMNQRTSISDYRAQLRFCGIFGVVTFAIALLGAAPAAAAACENLASFALPNAQIHSTQMVAAGAFVQPGGGRAGRGEGA